jgi:hypothetical protein
MTGSATDTFSLLAATFCPTSFPCEVQPTMVVAKRRVIICIWDFILFACPSLLTQLVPVKATNEPAVIAQQVA